MATRYEVHPSIGVARVGNSQGCFYLAPETLGGLPAECDANGNPIVENGLSKPVQQFKDEEGCIRRQGAQFKIFAYDDTKPHDPGREVTPEDGEIENIEWTVHLANRKAAWYRSSELEGDLMLGEQNRYQNRNVTWRNPGKQRGQPLIIDPGPRTVNQPNQKVSFSRDNIPKGRWLRHGIHSEGWRVVSWRAARLCARRIHKSSSRLPGMAGLQRVKPQ
jgi:L-lysine 6-oxidase